MYHDTELARPLQGAGSAAQARQEEGAMATFVTTVNITFAAVRLDLG